MKWLQSKEISTKLSITSIKKKNEMLNVLFQAGVLCPLWEQMDELMSDRLRYLLSQHQAFPWKDAAVWRLQGQAERIFDLFCGGQFILDAFKMK